MAAPLVRVSGLRVTFEGAQGRVHAVQGVDLELAPGRTLAILGESGSGKSVTLRALLGLLPRKRATVQGQVHVAGRDVLALTPRELGRYRGKVASMIFQDPGTALDPVYKVGQQIAEAIVHHEGVSGAEARRRAVEMLDRVKVPSAAMRANAYPHELSGGLRQRAMIALALACRPVLLLADEPTTALDPTVQIQIVHLLRELQQELGMSVIFVTHDVGVAVEVADEIAIMYAGRIVERAPTATIAAGAAHPYTVALLDARTYTARKGLRLNAIGGAPPALDRASTGCSFAPRCSRARSTCVAALPAATELMAGHVAHCLFPVPKQLVPRESANSPKGEGT
jgi:peptide/nickel transport system ATP-binding protein